MARDVSVVIIGPMGHEKDGSGQVPVADHLKNITAAVSQCAVNLKFQGKPYNLVPVSAEKIPGGVISNQVLLSLDKADFAIADISMRSPSVFYEIAILHALGRRTIFIDYKSQAGDPPFYLKGQLIKGVADFTVDEITSVLMDTFHAADSAFSGLWSNPISDFYTVPLVEAFAASGLATGYFHNFCRWVIADGHGVLAMLKLEGSAVSRELTHLAIIKPSSLQQIDETKKILNTIPDYQTGVKYRLRGVARDFVIVNTAGPYIVDYPSPLESVNASPSFNKLRELLMEINPMGAEAEIAKFEERIIATYLDTIARLARKTPGYNHKWLKFMTIDELMSEVGPRPRS